ncbi:MAG: RNA polymerase sigma-70 factor [Mediterranea sp.]|jgi:RNA polymerase sigma-70 factor (ECF subfamily)|nr:RNA polymerase sigma-70 factor [Mediterranea sp.]
MSVDNDIYFKKVYILHYPRLKRFAQEYVLVEEDAENIVHDVFTELWERWDTFSSHNNLLAFLFLSTKNKCIDLLRKRIISHKAENKIMEEYVLTLRTNLQSLDVFNQNISNEEEIEQQITRAINSLPDKCREIFIKNKIEGKKQKEIAEELNISIKTVEAQMSIAYKKLRVELKDYIPLFVFLFI